MNPDLSIYILEYNKNANKPIPPDGDSLNECFAKQSIHSENTIRIYNNVTAFCG